MTLLEFKNAIYELFAGSDDAGTEHMRNVSFTKTSGNKWPYDDKERTSPKAKAATQRGKTVQPYIPSGEALSFLEFKKTIKEFTPRMSMGIGGDAGGMIGPPGKSYQGGGQNGPHSHAAWANYKKNKKPKFPYDGDDEDVEEGMQPTDWKNGPVKLSKQKGGISKF